MAHSKYVILAPMVRGSELAYRMFVRNHGVELCYSPMLRASAIVSAYDLWKSGCNSASAGEFQVDRQQQQHLHEDGRLFLNDSCPEDYPLVVQLCGTCPQELYQATAACLDYFKTKHQNPLDGIDLNLGCPQECAKNGGFGAFLPPQQALECVKAIKRAIVEYDSKISANNNTNNKPPPPRLSCKFRLLESVPETIDFAQDLQDAGATVLAVHCRKRSDKHNGLPDLAAGKALVDAMQIPVWINGGIIETTNDIDAILQETGAAGVMIARPFLTNPTLLSLQHNTNASSTSSIIDPSRVADMAAEYLEYCKRYPPPSPLYIQKHLRWIFRDELQSKITRRPSPHEFRDDWRLRLWTFLVRPYLLTLHQFRQVVALYVNLRGCDLPESLREEYGDDAGAAADGTRPPPSFKSIRHCTKVDECFV